MFRLGALIRCLIVEPYMVYKGVVFDYPVHKKRRFGKSPLGNIVCPAEPSYFYADQPKIIL